jgi:hypothetical protein
MHGFHNPTLRLWKKDTNGCPQIPLGDPTPVPFKRIWGEEIALATSNHMKA